MEIRKTLSTWMTVTEVAKEARVTTATVRLWIAEKKLPATRVGPQGNWKVASEDFLRALIAGVK